MAREIQTITREEFDANTNFKSLVREECYAFARDMANQRLKGADEFATWEFGKDKTRARFTFRSKGYLTSNGEFARWLEDAHHDFGMFSEKQYISMRFLIRDVDIAYDDEFGIVPMSPDARAALNREIFELMAKAESAIRDEIQTLFDDFADDDYLYQTFLDCGMAYSYEDSYCIIDGRVYESHFELFG